MSWVKSLFGSRKLTLSIHDEYKTFHATGELYVPDKNKEGKSCLFLECELFFEIPGSPSSATVHITNSYYDPDQGGDESLHIEITKTLNFEKYLGHNMDGEEVKGFAFYDKGAAHLFQFFPGKDQKADAVELYMTQLIFEAKTGKLSKTVENEQLKKLCMYIFLLLIREKDEKSVMKDIAKDIKENEEKKTNELAQELAKLDVKEPIPAACKTSKYLKETNPILWKSKESLYKYDHELDENVLLEKEVEVLLIKLTSGIINTHIRKQPCHDSKI